MLHLSQGQVQHVGESVVGFVVIEGHVGHLHLDGVVFPVELEADLGVVLDEGLEVVEEFEEPLEQAEKFILHYNHTVVVFNSN